MIELMTNYISWQFILNLHVTQETMLYGDGDFIPFKETVEPYSWSAFTSNLLVILVMEIRFLLKGFYHISCQYL